MVERLDNALSNYAKIIKKQLGIDVDNIPGSGAAGGLGAGLMAFLNADLKKGIELVIKYTKLEEKIKGASYVFTGEGSIDSQTVFGKTPFGVATVAKKFNVPVIAFAGKIGDGVNELYNHGINSIIGILQGSVSLEEALKEGSKNIEKTSENIVRILNIK